MDPIVRRALTHGHLIDITTTGRLTGSPRRLEITFHNLDGRIYISGIPHPTRTRAWLRNLEANPRMVFHLKAPVRADLPATARVITDLEERTAVLTRIARIWRREPAEMIAHSPLIEVSIDGYEVDAAA